METILALRPFVPAKDFDVSKNFYKALGFAVTLEDETIAILKLESFSFILTKFYHQQAAENMMLQLMVRHAETWWGRVTAANLVETFGVRPPRAPAMQPWGMKVGFLFDPAGVLWHVAESIF